MGVKRGIQVATRFVDLLNESLFQKLKSDDPSAITFFIEKAQTPLCRFFYLLGCDKINAEDLTQEVLLSALKNLRSMKSPVHLNNWLYRAARNLFINFKKSMKIRSHESYEEALHAGLVPSPVQVDALLQAQDIFGQLTPDFSEVLILVDWDECSYKEAAEIIGISENAVRLRLHRARKAFQDKLKRN